MSVAAITKKERYALAVANLPLDRPPVWLMRQAGRYMPEYLALRERFSFMDLCLKPDAAAAATLLPIDLLDVDILIIFNDILVPLEAMGLQVDFATGGPVIVDPVRTEADLHRVRQVCFSNPPVARSLRMVKERAGEDIPVLGFAGAPFTMAAYAVEGRLTRDLHVVKELMYREPATFHELLRRLSATVADYLIAQIADGGADGVQLFESHAPALSFTDYALFAAPYQAETIARVKRACPDTPIHLYARGSGSILESMSASGADVLGVDWSLSLSEARERTDLPLQGNLDPSVMLVPEAVEREVLNMLEGFNWRQGWIANLGHGITPQAKVESAVQFVRCIQRLEELAP